MDQTEYNTIVQTYSKNIYRFLNKSVKDPECVKDILQDTFLKFWQHRNNIEIVKAKSWLFVTAYRFMLKLIKQRKLYVSIDHLTEEIQFTNNSASANFNIKETIDKCLDTLPVIQKNIILLRDLEGYNYKEIGDILQLSEEQVKVYLFRGRQKIKNQIKSIHHLL
ncbi:MAG: RNA polymerase sigma factor [Cytophagales bacterium]|nr:RNA polymerase sigma factor [Cytophaga sp.]